MTRTPQVFLFLMRLSSTLGAGMGTFLEVSTTMFLLIGSFQFFPAAMCPAAALHVIVPLISR